MDKFEYLFETWRSESPVDDWHGNYATEDCTDHLNKKGVEGWELVYLEYHLIGIYTLCFKRRRELIVEFELNAG